MKREDEGRSGTMYVVRDSYESRVTSTISNTGLLPDIAIAHLFHLSGLLEVVVAHC